MYYGHGEYLKLLHNYCMCISTLAQYTQYKTTKISKTYTTYIFHITPYYINEIK